MITLFASPKPFRGHIAVIQRNAIQSWLQLRPACEIILLGDDEGTADVAREFGLRHIPDVARNEYGTPLLNSLFELAQAAASHRLLAYVNTDIILVSDFVAAVRRIPFRRFVMVGRRWDLDLNQPWDFSHPDWEANLRAYLSEHGVLHSPTGIDYFVFPPGLWDPIPPFAVGRTAWDNWLIYQARALGVDVVDATGAVTAIHQNHDYALNVGDFPDGVEEIWKGPEAQRNRALAGGPAHNPNRLNIQDANWLLGRRWLLPSPALGGKTKRLLRYIAIRHPHLYKALWVLAQPYKLLSFVAHYKWHHLLRGKRINS
jgi:hypothetical protein